MPRAEHAVAVPGRSGSRTSSPQACPEARRRRIVSPRREAEGHAIVDGCGDVLHPLDEGQQCLQAGQGFASAPLSEQVRTLRTTSLPAWPRGRSIDPCKASWILSVSTEIPDARRTAVSTAVRNRARGRRAAGVPPRAAPGTGTGLPTPRVQVGAEDLDVPADQGRSAVAGQRNRHITSAPRRRRPGSQPLPTLCPEHGRAHSGMHVRERPASSLRSATPAGMFSCSPESGSSRLIWPMSGIRGQVLLNALGDRLDDLLPCRPGGLEPFATTPRGRGR